MRLEIHNLLYLAVISIASMQYLWYNAQKGKHIGIVLPVQLLKISFQIKT